MVLLFSLRHQELVGVLLERRLLYLDHFVHASISFFEFGVSVFGLRLPVGDGGLVSLLEGVGWP